LLHFNLLLPISLLTEVNRIFITFGLKIGGGIRHRKEGNAPGKPHPACYIKVFEI
jgi:hypothetical protein